MILKILEWRLERNRNRVDICGWSVKAKMKAVARMNESSEALGEVRNYVRNPERI